MIKTSSKVLVQVLSQSVRLLFLQCKVLGSKGRVHLILHYLLLNGLVHSFGPHPITSDSPTNKWTSPFICRGEIYGPFPKVCIVFDLHHRTGFVCPQSQLESNLFLQKLRDKKPLSLQKFQPRITNSQGVKMGVRNFVWSSRLLLLLLVPSCFSGDISLYDYFAGQDITEGLTAQGQEFKLNGKEIKILSGSFHYFR